MAINLIPELQQVLEALFLMILREGIPPEQCQLVAAHLISEALAKSAIEAEFREEASIAQREEVIPPGSQHQQAIQHSQPASNHRGGFYGEMSKLRGSNPLEPNAIW